MNIVLVRPQIPPNTGNIARLCAATNCKLHLIGPMGFSISDKQVRRAGLDYWEHVNVIEHHDWDDFVRSVNSDRLFYFSTKGKNVYWDHQFQKDDYLIFGSETAGLPEDLLNENKETVYTLPMPGPIRSLNLATSVGIVVYEGLRQIQL